MTIDELNEFMYNHGFCNTKNNEDLPKKYVADLVESALEEGRSKAIDEFKENNKQVVCEIKIDAEMMRKIIDEKMTQIELDIQEIRAKAIDDFSEKLKKIIEKDLANPDLMLDCKKCGIWKAKDIDEIAEQMKGGGNDVETN